MLGSIFLIFTTLASLIILVIRSGSGHPGVTILFCGSLATIVIAAGIPLALPDQSVELTGWNQIVGISCTLTALSGIIRKCKPVYARYPILFVYFPLLLIPFYYLISDMSVLVQLLNQLLQGGALVIISLLIVAFYRKMDQNRLLFLGGVTGIAITYLIYWFLPATEEAGHTVWRVTLGLSLLLTTVSIHNFLNEIKT